MEPRYRTLVYWETVRYSVPWGMPSIYHKSMASAHWGENSRLSRNSSVTVPYQPSSVRTISPAPCRALYKGGLQVGGFPLELEGIPQSCDIRRINSPHWASAALLYQEGYSSSSSESLWAFCPFSSEKGLWKWQCCAVISPFAVLERGNVNQKMQALAQRQAPRSPPQKTRWGKGFQLHSMLFWIKGHRFFILVEYYFKSSSLE